MLHADHICLPIAWKNVFMKTDTMVLLIHFDAKNNLEEINRLNHTFSSSHQTILNCPSIKLLINFSNSGRLIDSIVILTCDEFCSITNIGQSLRLSALNFFNLEQVRKIYKQIFWNSQNKKVPAYIIHTYLSIFDESHTKNFLCDIIYKNHNFQLMSAARHCWAKQMLAGELAKIHNLTYVKWQSGVKGSFIRQDVHDKQHKFNPLWYEDMYLQYYSGFGRFITAWILTFGTKHLNWDTTRL